MTPDPLRAALEEVFEPYLRLAGMALPTMAKVLDGATARLAAYHGVRAALAADTAPEHALHYDPDCEECVYLARPTVLRLAADTAPLDVERLARALGSTGNCGHSSCPRDTSRHDDDARDIAAEYARLAETPRG